MCLHSSCSPPDNPSGAAASGRDPQQITAVKIEAEKLFAQREDLHKLREAITLLSKVRDPHNRDYEVEWKFARYNYFLGRHSTDEEEAENAFDAGKDAAKIASNMEPRKPDGYFWHGANLGELCKRSPITVGLQSVAEVREAMNKVIDIEPSYQGASAFHGLAQIELGTRMNGGSAEKAVEFLEKAMGIDKDNSNLYLHLAEAYLALGKDAEAKKQLESLLKMRPNPEYIPEHKQATESARKLLQTKF